MALSLRRLGPEPYGARLSRARETAGFTTRQVEEILFPHVTRGALARLEARQIPPTYRKDRNRVALLIYLYGFDQEEFEITDGDMPPIIDLKALAALREQWHCSSRVEQCATDLDQAA